MNLFSKKFILAGIIAFSMILLTIGVTMVGNFGVALVVDGIISLIIAIAYAIGEFS